MKNKILPAISIGVILQWLSLFFSYYELSNTPLDISKPIATGGFPIQIFYYPVSPMGNDWPSAQSWSAFFLNLAIWLVVGFIIALLSGERIEKKKWVMSLGILAILLTVLGGFYLMFMLD